MEVIWMPDPEKDYLDTLNFWYKHNGSPTYSKKIDSAVKVLEKEIAKNPYFMAKFYEEFNLYRRTILKGRFLIFYEVKEEENLINILHFRSSYQQPLEEIL